MIEQPATPARGRFADTVRALTVVAGVLLTGTALAQSAPPLLPDNKAKLIVGMPPGGGVDLYARLLQRHLPKYLPGAPTIIVQNMPGAGSLRSVLALASTASADDAVIGTFSPSLISEAILNPERVKVDFRDFAFIGNVSEDNRVCYIRSELDVKTFDELMKRDAINFGGTAPGAFGYVDTVALKKALGVKLNQILGYAGSAEKKLALDRGEIDGDCGGFATIPPEWLAEKRVNIVLRFSPRVLSEADKDAVYGGDEIKSAEDRQAYDFMMLAPQLLGRPFIVSKKMPPEQIAALRAAFDKAVADPAFIAEAQKLTLPVIPMRGEEVDKRVADLYATPPQILDKVRNWLAE